MDTKPCEVFDIFIFCGGKCGGTTLFKTFETHHHKTLFLHSFSFLNNYTYITNVPESIQESSKLKPIYIIDCYRTPIERKMSSFFQGIHKFIPDYKNKTVEELIEFFNTKFFYQEEEYHPINEALTHFDIPLWTTFDFKNGYNKLEQDNKIFVKILFRDIDKWDSILSEILGQPITLHSDNISDEKEYATLYKEFKALYKVPKNYLENQLLKNNEFKIYNTKEEQKEYIENWTARSI